MRVEIVEQAFDPWARLQAYQAERLQPGQYGATTAFIGTMRDFNEGDDVSGMMLEHYPGMTANYLEKISKDAADKWSLLDSLIIHRVGPLAPNEPIVMVVVWSAHRKDAFEASRWLMEELKSNAPFWKKETLKDGGGRWVEKNSDGY